jgi:AcrR family transcriptional regulator
MAVYNDPVSPRPRQATDEDILKAAFRAITRLGPAKLTLNDVAAEAGISAAALVQRFGSKRALLLAAAKDAASGGAYIFPGVRAKYRSPVAAIVGLAECMSLMGTSPAEIANNLAFLQIDLTDADFHRHALAASAGMRSGLRALVRDAIAAGEIAKCDASRLASALHATLNGSMLNWAVHRTGSMTDWIARDLRAVLAPHVTARRKKEEGRRKKEKRKKKSRGRKANDEMNED